MNPFNQIISNFPHKKILVVGDILLDQYIRGSVSRISPEAPVPLVLQEGPSLYTPGGAANVANNLRSLGVRVTLVGRIGPDGEGKIFLRELKKQRIPPDGIFIDKKIPTILKTRIIAHNQQVLRLDRETIDVPGDGSLMGKVKNFIRTNIGSLDAVIISDYGKGMISPALVREVCSLAINQKKIIAVDPKVEHFAYYQGVTAITPNRKETENAIHNIKITHRDGKKLAVHVDSLKSDADIDSAGQALLNFLNLECLLITLGEQGMRLFEKGRKPVYIPTRAREVFDVTGAGDTVISIFTLALTAGATKRQAAELANYAAGIVVGKMGAVAVSPVELSQAIRSFDLRSLALSPKGTGLAHQSSGKLRRSFLSVGVPIETSGPGWAGSNP